MTVQEMDTKNNLVSNSSADGFGDQHELMIIKISKLASIIGAL